MESAGFKEWAIVCDAIGRGEQCIILRKGGIAEGRAGFSFRAREFFLFPTYFHEQLGRTRGQAREIPLARAGEIELRVFAKIETASVITNWETASSLAPLHILQADIVRERFEYDEAPGIHVALLRAFRLTTPWIIPDAPAFAGCRSWVKLPAGPASMPMTPVLSDLEHARRVAAFRQLTNSAS